MALKSQSPDSPSVIDADPVKAEPARQFWKNNCHDLRSGLQFIGLDADQWTDLGQMSRWVEELRAILAKEDNGKRFLLTTIIILAWPDSEKGNEGDFAYLDRFRDVLLAGANLRLKRARYYQRNDGNFLESLHEDLWDSGLLAPTDSSPSPKMLEKPVPTNAQEKCEYEQSLEFYGDPPFQWDPDQLAELFKKGSSMRDKNGQKPLEGQSRNKLKTRKKGSSRGT